MSSGSARARRRSGILPMSPQQPAAVTTVCSALVQAARRRRAEPPFRLIFAKRALASRSRRRASPRRIRESRRSRLSANRHAKAAGASDVMPLVLCSLVAASQLAARPRSTARMLRVSAVLCERALRSARSARWSLSAAVRGPKNSTSLSFSQKTREAPTVRLACEASASSGPQSRIRRAMRSARHCQARFTTHAARPERPTSPELTSTLTHPPPHPRPRPRSPPAAAAAPARRPASSSPPGTPPRRAPSCRDTSCCRRATLTAPRQP